MVRRVAFGAIALSVAACSLFTDLGGFSKDDDRAADGATTSDVAASETSIDQQTPSLDGGGGDAEAGLPPPACTPNANTFCEDFDKSTMLDPGWGLPSVERGEVYVEPRADAPSPANVLRSSINESPSNTAFAQIIRNFPTVPTESVTFEQDILIDKIGTAYANLFSIDLRTDSGSIYSLQLTHQSGEAFIEEYSKVAGVQAHSFLTQRTTAITIGAWHHVVMSMKTTVPRTYSFTIDGNTFFTRPVKDEAPADPFTSGTIRVVLGISYQQQGPAVKIFTDNAKVTWK